jgi:hypothetical protein
MTEMRPWWVHFAAAGLWTLTEKASTVVGWFRATEGANDEVLLVAGAQCPMALKLHMRMGSIRHKSIEEAVAGEGVGLIMNGSGGTRSWRWGNLRIHIALGSLVNTMSLRGMRT